MPLLTADHNKKLKDAANARPDTRPRVGKAANLSAQVAYRPSGNNASAVEENKKVITKSPPASVRTSDRIGGSMEGYMRAAPAFIQMKNSGYDNPKNQQARQQKNTYSRAPQINQRIANFSGDFKKPTMSGIINNYSRFMKASTSGAKIAEASKIERMFK